MPTKDIFNARTQQVESAELTVDANSEIVATFADGGFLKFPSKLEDGETDITTEVLDKLIAAHEEANTGQEVVTPEMEAAAAQQKAAAFEAIGVDPTNEAAVQAATTVAEPAPVAPTNSGNTMPAGDTTNAPADPAPTA